MQDTTLEINPALLNKDTFEHTKADLIDLGAIRKTVYDEKRTEMEKYILLHKVKQRKSYKEKGMTWEEFCNAIGESKVTVDRNLKELQPVINHFLEASQKMLGMELPRIKLLARSIDESDVRTEAGAIVVNGEKVPFDEEHKEEIEMLIDELIDQKKKAQKESRKAKKDFKLALERKDTVIKKLHSNIKKYEAETAETECTPEELSHLKELETCKKTIEGITNLLLPQNYIREDLSPKLKASYMSTLAYMKHVADTLWNEISPNSEPKLIDMDAEAPDQGLLLDNMNDADYVEDTTNI